MVKTLSARSNDTVLRGPLSATRCGRAIDEASCFLSQRLCSNPVSSADGVNNHTAARVVKNKAGNMDIIVANAGMLSIHLARPINIQLPIPIYTYLRLFTMTSSGPPHTPPTISSSLDYLQ